MSGSHTICVDSTKVMFRLATISAVDAKTLDDQECHSVRNSGHGVDSWAQKPGCSCTQRRTPRQPCKAADSIATRLCNLRRAYFPRTSLFGSETEISPIPARQKMNSTPVVFQAFLSWRQKSSVSTIRQNCRSHSSEITAAFTCTRCTALSIGLHSPNGRTGTSFEHSACLQTAEFLKI